MVVSEPYPKMLSPTGFAARRYGIHFPPTFYFDDTIWLTFDPLRGNGLRRSKKSFSSIVLSHEHTKRSTLKQWQKTARKLPISHFLEKMLKSPLAIPRLTPQLRAFGLTLSSATYLCNWK